MCPARGDRRRIRSALRDQRRIVPQHPADGFHVAEDRRHEDVHVRAVIDQQSDEIAPGRNRGEVYRGPVELSRGRKRRRPSRQQPANDLAMAASDGVVQRPCLALPVRAVAQRVDEPGFRFEQTLERRQIPAFGGEDPLANELLVEWFGALCFGGLLERRPTRESTLARNRELGVSQLEIRFAPTYGFERRSDSLDGLGIARSCQAEERLGLLLRTMQTGHG
jgi:hypothetical protein